MQRNAKRNPEIQRHAAEKLDEVNKARFRREKGIMSPRTGDRRRTADGNKRGGEKNRF